MANDNLNFRKPHMTFVDGYFYMFDDDTDMLLQKTDDGVTSFSFPFDTLMSNTVDSIEHDGVNFWSMEDGSADDTKVIRRWALDNYACKLQSTVTLSNPAHTFSSDTFSVEHYHCTISGGYSEGDTIITVDVDTELPGLLQSGMAMTIGPNTAGRQETINIQHVAGKVITLADPLEYSYINGDSFQFYNYLWMFNNAHGTNTSTGALYKINAYSGSVIATYPGGVYKGVKAATFSEITHFTELGAVNSLMYVKASNLLFININSASLDYYGSMAMDTIKDDEVSIITVYDLAVYNKNVYRLQRFATYYGATEGWATYNYQAATFNSMVASIGMVASPNIIAANGTSVSEIIASVRDQFAQPIDGRLVYFAVDSENDGAIVDGQEIVNTGSGGMSAGKAQTTYRAGEVAELVRILARVDQV